MNYEYKVSFDGKWPVIILGVGILGAMVMIGYGFHKVIKFSEEDSKEFDKRSREREERFDQRRKENQERFDKHTNDMFARMERQREKMFDRGRQATIIPFASNSNDITDGSAVEVSG